MTLHDLTEDTIKQFAGSTIFNRGYNYYVDGMVLNLDYQAESDTIEAEVAGNYGDYEVTITASDNWLDADCTCPYEGYPCKHIVAALLTFLHNQNQYKQQARQQRATQPSLAQKIKKLSKDELVELLLAYSKTYPDVKRDLMIRLEAEKQATFASLQKQINRAFPSVESRNYSIATIAKQLRAILKAIENAPASVQRKVYWAVTDRVLQELNDYGINDETLENVAIQTMENLVEAFAADESLHEERTDVIEQLMDYYNWGNCGLVDWIYDTVVQLCTSRADYEVVIAKLEHKLTRASFKSYYQDLLADLYEQIGDSEARLKTLERHLQYGGDYWRLAQYWFEHGNDDKAWEVVQEGIEQGEGRKVELYEALQQRYQQRQDYEQIFQLLRQKLERNELDYSRNLTNDSTYQCLWEHYAAAQDYAGQTKLLQLRLNYNDVTLDLYQTAEQTLRAADWAEFEARIIENLQQCIAQQHAQRKGFGLFYPAHSSAETTILAEIYHHKHELDLLFEIVKPNLKLLQQYQEVLLPRYPVEYLERYQEKIDRLIAARGRDNYKAAVPYAQTVKQIYTEILRKPEECTRYLTELRQKHTRLRAFQEEFAAL
jgi:uncharacterized Zn finger protein